MNKVQLEEMKPGELVQYAKDLGLNTKGKNPRALVPLILQKIAGESADEGDDAPDSALVDASGTHITGLNGETPEEIISEEETLLDDEGDDAPDYKAMTEEEVMMHMITQAEAGKADPAVLTALYNAYERLTAKPEEQPPQPHSAETHPTVHTANALHTGRPPKAGSHWPTPEEAIQTLAPYSKRGLIITRIPKLPHMLKLVHGSRELAISLKQPLRTVIQHANLLMRPTGKPTEDLSYEELVDLRHKQLKK